MTHGAEHSLTFSLKDKLVVTACGIAILIVQVDWFALNLTLPVIARHFNLPVTDLQWVISGYMLSAGALMVTAGRLADIFGRRKIIVIGLTIFGTMSAVSGCAPNENWLIVARVVQGIGAALIYPVSIALVSSTFTGARQARGLAIVLGLSSIGTAIGPFVGGVFSEYSSWRGVFFINIPFCVISILLLLKLVKESRDEEADRHVDILGVLAITGALACISLAFDRGEAWGWTSAYVIGTVVVGGVLSLVFVAVEARSRAPLINLSMVRNRTFDAVIVAGSLTNVVFCLIAVFSSMYLQQIARLSPLSSGTVFLALSAGAALASYLSGWITERFSADRVMAIGMIVGAFALIGLTSVKSLLLYVPLFFVTGLGLGVSQALAIVATQAVTPPSFMGSAAGVVLTSRVLLGAVGVAIASAVLELLAGSPIAAGTDADAINMILRTGAVLALLGAGCLFSFGRRRSG